MTRRRRASCRRCSSVWSARSTPRCSRRMPRRSTRGRTSSPLSASPTSEPRRGARRGLSTTAGAAVAPRHVRARSSDTGSRWMAAARNLAPVNASLPTTLEPGTTVDATSGPRGAGSARAVPAHPRRRHAGERLTGLHRRPADDGPRHRPPRPVRTRRVVSPRPSGRPKRALHASETTLQLERPRAGAIGMHRGPRSDSGLLSSRSRRRSSMQSMRRHPMTFLMVAAVAFMAAACGRNDAEQGGRQPRRKPAGSGRRETGAPAAAQQRARRRAPAS